MHPRALPVLLLVFLALCAALFAQGHSPVATDLVGIASLSPAARASLQRFGPPLEVHPSLVLNRDGSRLLIGDGSSSAYVWNVRAHRLLHSFKAIPEGGSFVAFTPLETQVFMSSAVIEAPHNRMVRPFPLSQSTVAVNAQGTRLLGFEDQTLTLWDLASGRRLQTFGRGPTASSYRSSAGWMALSADGSQIAVADEARRVRVWDSRSGKLTQWLESGMDVLGALAFSPDGSRLLLGGSVTPFWPTDAVAVKVWDLEQRRWTGQFKAPGGEAVSVAMSADGSSILAGHRSPERSGLWPVIRRGQQSLERFQVLMWDTRTGARSTLFERVQSSGAWTPLAFSADGSRVALEVGGEVWVFTP